MDPEEIKIEFFKRRRQVTMKEIAAKLGVTPAAITRVIDRDFKSRRIQEAVAEAIERPLKEVFPEADEPECHDRRRAACR